MKMQQWRYEGIDKDGVCKDGGAVSTEAEIRISRGEGCGLPKCNCSPGVWLMVGLPRTDKGIVEGITVHFDSVEEMDKALEK